ncbi:penicillin-binding protein 2 [Candidatus Uhrbacteria bacterium]|nr:penicillin-binding protein 2 [Candidatus Uhrbacteria bacterium]
MSFFRRPSSSRVFVLQEDNRFGSRTPRLHEVPVDLSLGAQMSSRFGSVSVTVSKKRLRLIGLLLLGVLLTFSGRSVQLQVVQGASYRALSEENRYSTQVVVPPRGVILDRTGEPLAWNQSIFVLTMDPRTLPEDEQQKTDLFLTVAALTGLQRTDLDLLLANASAAQTANITVLEDIPYETSIRLATHISLLPGFALETRSMRRYDSSIPSLSHVLGYTGSMNADEYASLKSSNYRIWDEIGKAGVEKEYETVLRGTPGTLVSEVDARGEKVSIVSQTHSQEAGTMLLSLDAAFQKFVEQKLTETLSRVGASRGSVVALDPRSGAVRALVSLPTFESNDFVGGIPQDRYEALLNDPDQPLFPRAISGEYPSGSIFKPFVAYAALAEGIVGEHTSFLSTGGVRIGQWFFPDWKAGGHGVTDVRKAIAQSVNTYFYIVGGGLDDVTGLGVERISTYAKRFGFGSPTGIDLPGEADGFLPSKEWKEQVKGERWYVGDTYHYAIGQGDFLTTPLQMAVAVSTIANGGNRYVPYVVESVDGAGASRIVHQAPVTVEGLDASALELVREGMRETVTSGSARSLSVLTQAVAGKTGTAQTPGGRPYHSWFIGFGPYEDPTLTLVVMVEEGGESTDAAVPLAKELFRWWFQHS